MKNIGITFESKFTVKNIEIISIDVRNQISKMVKQGFTYGVLYGQNLNYCGSWVIDIEKGHDDIVYVINEYIGNKIYEGYESGYYPTFSWSANIWK